MKQRGRGGRHRAEGRHRDHERAPLDAARRLCRLSLQAAATRGLPASRLRAPHQHRPQPLRRLHGGARRRRRARHRHHAQLLHGDAGSSAAASTRSPAIAVIGVSIALCRGRTVVIADTAVHDMPNSEELADIAEEAAGVARRLGFDAARGDARLLDLRQSLGRARGEGAGGGAHPRQPPRRLRI